MGKKVVIMAAGKGVRMRPLTADTPKPLIEINGKPYILYLLERLSKAGYDDFGIIVGYKKEKMIGFLTKTGLKFMFIEQKTQLGTGDAVKTARDFAGKDNFLLCGADNLWSVKDIKSINYDDKLNYVCGIKRNDWQKYGVLVEENSFLKKIVEKPKEFAGDLINTGLYKFTPEIFDALEQIKKSERGEYELTDAITLLAKKGKVKVAKVKDYWLDLGSKDDVEMISSFLRKCAE